MTCLSSANRSENANKNQLCHPFPNTDQLTGDPGGSRFCRWWAESSIARTRLDALPGAVLTIELWTPAEPGRPPLDGYVCHPLREGLSILEGGRVSIYTGSFLHLCERLACAASRADGTGAWGQPVTHSDRPFETGKRTRNELLFRRAEPPRPKRRRTSRLLISVAR